MKFRCENCSKEFESKDSRRRFCSLSCSAKKNNIGVSRHHGTKKKSCKHCGDGFLVSQHRNRTYCSKCIADGIPSSIRKIVDLADATTDRIRRRILVDRNGCKCFVCLRDTWGERPMPVELDHIDGDSTNNSEENLRLICPNCHAFTDTYKGKNKGHGRHKRLKRYRDGLSY